MIIAFRLTGITAVFAALAWLPAIIRIIALAGGGFKTPAGEATTSGLLDLLRSLDPGIQRQALPSVIAALDVAEPTVPAVEKARVREIRQDLEGQLASLPSGANVWESFKRLAQEYEDLRHKMPSGPERTFKMARIVTEARALARQSKLEPMNLTDLYTSKKEGDRIVIIAAIQAFPKPLYLDVVIDAIGHSQSAFEQYQALRAAEAMLPFLSEEQNQRLVDVLQDQRSGRPGKYIVPGSDRWSVSDRILATLRAA
jgi:hypothetical protein